MLKNRRRTARAAALAALTSLGIVSPAAGQPASDPNSDWALRCFAEKACIVQTGLRDEKGAAVAILALTRNPEKGLVGELRTPTGLLIPSGVRIRVDSLQFRPSLITCLPQACLSSFDVTSDVLRAMRKGESFDVLYTEALTGKDITLPFSLKGFSARFKEFSARKK